MHCYILKVFVQFICKVGKESCQNWDFNINWKIIRTESFLPWSRKSCLLPWSWLDQITEMFFVKNWFKYYVWSDWSAIWLNIFPLLNLYMVLNIPQFPFSNEFWFYFSRKCMHKAAFSKNFPYKSYKRFFIFTPK